MGGNRKTGFSSVFAFNNVVAIGYCDFPESDINQCSYNRAHHIPKKTISGNGKNELVVLLFPIRFKNVAIKRVDVGVDFRKTLKIGVIEQQLRGFIHPFQIRLLVQIPTCFFQKWIFGGMNVVFVGSFCRIETRMCFIVNRNDVVNGDVFWQK